VAVAALLPAASLAAIQLTNGPFSVVDYEWSPDNATIAMAEMTPAGTTRISRVASGGGPVIPLTGDAQDYSSPHWSADGQLLLTSYLDTGLGRRTICAIRAADGICMFPSGSLDQINPTFSPIGQPFEVVASRIFPDSSYSVIRLDLLAHNEQFLTDPGRLAVNPQWATHLRGVLYDGIGSNFHEQVFEVPPGGGPGTQVTNCSCEVCHEDECPIDGTIAYSAGYFEGSGANQIYMQPIGLPPVPLTFENVNHSAPIWMPNGAFVIYDRPDAQGHVNVFRVARDGMGLEIQMTFGPAVKRLGKVSPNGNYLTYVQFDEPDHAYHLYRIDFVAEANDYGSSEVARTPYPNPFRESTRLEVDVPGDRPAGVAVEIYDVSGAAVRLLELGVRPPGRHVITWDGRDRERRSVADGVYFYRATVGTQMTRGTLVLRR
jgi:hypothetical protein